MAISDIVQQLNALGLDADEKRIATTFETQFKRREFEKDRQLQILLAKMAERAKSKASKRRTLMTVGSVLGGAILAPAVAGAGVAPGAGAAGVGSGVAAAATTGGQAAGLAALDAAVGTGAAASGGLIGGIGNILNKGRNFIGNLLPQGQQQPSQPNFGPQLNRDIFSADEAHGFSDPTPTPVFSRVDDGRSNGFGQPARQGVRLPQEPIDMRRLLESIQGRRLLETQESQRLGQGIPNSFDNPEDEELIKLYLEALQGGR